MKNLPQIIFSVLLVCAGNIIAQEKPKNKQFKFIENNGQIVDQTGKVNTAVEYLLPLNENLSVQLKEEGFSYDTYARNESGKRAFQRVDIKFLNANPTPLILPEKEQSDYINYYTSGLSDNSAFKTKHFGSILYQDIYPNIDIRFSTTAEQTFKFDFILHPGANINDIQLEYSGFTQAHFDEHITLNLEHQVLIERIPKSWFAASNQPVDIDFALIEKTEGSMIVGYQSPELLNNRTLIIDPELALVWGTYYGDTLVDAGTDVMTDNIGKVYMTGYTQSITNLATAGVHQDTLAGGLFDAYILKTDQFGNRIWSTYFGGSGLELTNAIMVDTFFNVTITGFTNSPDGIASDSCYQNSLAGASDAFVAQFNSNGQRLWSTYFGGALDDSGAEIDTDYDGYVYVAGKTQSATNIALGVSHQSAIGGLTDGFLAKLDSFGFPVWSTYYGGADEDEAIAVAQEGNQIVISGTTSSLTNIASTGAHKENYSAEKDAFLACFNQDGARNWGTYYGDDELDKATDVEIYNTKIYMVGITNSENNIVTQNAHKSVIDSTDAFLVKFDTLGTRMWGTYFGGESYDEAIEIGVELDSNIYVFGNTFSATQIASYDNYDTTYAAESDGFIAKFHYSGYFMHATYYGGNEEDKILGGDVYGNTAVYVCGYTKSADSIAYNTNLQDTLAGLQDGFLTRFNTKISTQCSGVSGFPGIDTICQDTLNFIVADGALGQGANWVWYIDGCGVDGTQIHIGDTLTYMPPLGLFALFVRAESVNNATDCGGLVVWVEPKPTAEITVNDTLLCAGETLELTSGSADYYDWTGPNGFQSSDQTATLDTIQVADSGYYHLFIDNGYGCSANDSVQIAVLDVPNVSSVVAHTSCEGINDGSILATIDGLDPLTFNWLNYSADTLFIDSLFAGYYVLEVGDSNGCSVIDSIAVNNPISIIDTLITSPENCTAEDGTVQAAIVGNASDYNIQWQPNGANTALNDNLSAGWYTVTLTDSLGCSYVDSAEVDNQNLLQIDTLIATDESCYGAGDGTAEVFASGGLEAYQYHWNPDHTTAAISGLNQGYYVATVTDKNGCIRTDSIYINSNPEISITIDELVHTTCDEKNGAIQVTASGGSGDFTYLWDPTGSTDSYLIDLDAGNYLLVVTDSIGCTKDSTFYINPSVNPEVNISASESQIQVGESTSLEAIVNPAGNYTYNWTPSSDVSCATCQITDASPLIGTTFEVTVIDENGCTASDDIYIDVVRCQDFFLPTIFSPNGDLLNDEWNVMGDCIKSYSIEVFNRWGERIFVTTSQQNSWDGTYKGSKVENGSYVYQLELEYTDGEKVSQSGNVKVVK
ncbi:MAG: gliding motility-associated C-terminal domain-containing protein [Crocinitomicaceae bacterium]